MKDTKTMTYAITCLQELANQLGDYVRVSDIARKHDLPAAYCQKILLILSRAGIVGSVKGQGFTLIRPVEEISPGLVGQALSPERKSMVPAICR